MTFDERLWNPRRVTVTGTKTHNASASRTHANDNGGIWATPTLTNRNVLLHRMQASHHTRRTGAVGAGGATGALGATEPVSTKRVAKWAAEADALGAIGAVVVGIRN